MAMDRPSLTRATTFVTTSLEKKNFKNPKAPMIFEYFAYISIGSYPIDVMRLWIDSPSQPLQLWFS